MPHTRILENFVLNETLRLEGPEWNNTIIRNVIIEDVDGSGILLRDVENIRIENVTIRNVTGDGIKLSTLGSTRDVTITGSHISQVGDDGINAGQRADAGVDHPGLQIIGNTIENVGLNGTNQGLMHGMYIQSTDFLIEDNYIKGVQDGNGISVRSSGQISDNYIEDTRQSGIAYFPDNEKGPSDQLRIAGNVLVNTGQGTDRSDINLLEIRSGSQDRVVSSIVIQDNIVTKPEETAITVNPDYAQQNVQVLQYWNQFAEETLARLELESGAYGGSGSTFVGGSDTDLTPGAGDMPALFGADNMRLTLGDGALGRTESIVTQGDAQLADHLAEAGTQAPTININEMGLRVSAYSGNDSARIGVDSGKMAVLSAGEDVSFAGSGTMEISGDETVVLKLVNPPVGPVTQFALGMDGVDAGEMVSFELFSRGTFLGRFEQPAEEIIRLDSNVSFDEIRISPGEGTGFALTWAEFGQSSETGPLSAEVTTMTTALSLESASYDRTLASLDADTGGGSTLTVGANTKLSEVTVSDLMLNITANGRRVSIDNGEMGVSSSGERGDALSEISGGEELVFNFRETDAVSVTLDFAQLEQNEVVVIEAFHNGRSVGFATYMGQEVVDFGGLGAFDTLAVSAGEDSSFAVEAIEAERLFIPDGDFI